MPLFIIATLITTNTHSLKSGQTEKGNGIKQKPPARLPSWITTTPIVVATLSLTTEEKRAQKYNIMYMGIMCFKKTQWPFSKKILIFCLLLFSRPPDHPASGFLMQKLMCSLHIFLDASLITTNLWSRDGRLIPFWKFSHTFYMYLLVCGFYFPLLNNINQKSLQIKL